MKKKGFSLLEVLVALLILVATVSFYSSTQLRSVLKITKEKEYLDRIFVIQSEFIDFIDKQLEKMQKVLKKDIESPRMKVVSQLMDIDKKSSLNLFVNDLKIVKTQGNWNSIGNNFVLSFVTFIESEKKEKK